jgi:predicted nucleic acid-binding protein
VTHRKIFKTPVPLVEAITFSKAIQPSENGIMVAPSFNHWNFMELCHAIQATGNDIPDAYFAALAIESDCTWVTADKGFLRFPQLKCKLLEV